MIFLGFALTGIVSWMLVQTADYFNARQYEEIALKAFGTKMVNFTSVMMVLTQLGFVIAYIVLLKTMLPMTI